MNTPTLVRAMFLGAAFCVAGESLPLRAEENPVESAAADGLPAAGSLLPNGDLEKPDARGDWPEGWGNATPGSGRTWEVENGKHFLRLAAGKTGGAQTIYREVKLEAGEISGLTLAIRYRTAKADADARVMLVFKDATGRLLMAKTLPLSATATDWTEASEPMRVPKAATRMIVIAGWIEASAGTLEISEIGCTPLPRAEAEKLAADETGVAGGMDEAWLANGDFEKANAAGDWPEGWGSPAAGMSWEKEADKHFIRLASQQPGESVMLRRTIPLKPGVAGIELMVRSRTAGVLHGEHEWFDARTIVHFLGADGKPLPKEGGGLDVVFTHKPAPTDWVERTRTYAVPEGAVELQMMTGLFRAAAGRVDVGEIRVRPVGEAAVEVLKITDAAYAVWKADEDAAMERRVEAQIGSQLAATGNLVWNGAFEQAGKNAAWPDGWGNAPSPGVSWEAEDGKHFLRLTAPAPEKTLMLYKMIVLPAGLSAVEVTVRYRLTNFVKGENMPGDARVALHFLNGTRFGHLENGKEMSPKPAAMIFSPDAADWTEIRQRCAVPEGATKLQWMGGLWGAKSGTLDVAEIRAVPVQ